MAVFTELDWQRIDVWAIVGSSGLATLEERQRPQCHEWLARNDYEIITLDCGHGVGATLTQLTTLLDWEAQFGYVPSPTNCNLDALSDGFNFDVRESGGRVLEILHPGVAWREDSRWFLGLLSIAAGHSRAHLAQGSRFFTLLLVSDDSPAVGAVAEEIRVPPPFWNSGPTLFP